MKCIGLGSTGPQISKFSALTLLILLLTIHEGRAQYSQQSTLGMSYAYAPEIEASGVGFTILRPFNERFSLGLEATYFFRQRVHESMGLTSIDYNRRTRSSQLFLRSELWGLRSLNLYGAAGLLYHVESRSGFQTVYNDAPPYEVTQNRIEDDNYTISGAITAGLEWNRRVRIFAEPELLLINPVQVAISTGIRIPL